MSLTHKTIILMLSPMKNNHTPCPNHSEFVPVLAKGLCAACYMKQRRGGGGTRAKNGTHYPLAIEHRAEWLNRFLDKVALDEKTGCQEWTAQKTNGGYGVFTFINHTLLAHRLAFALQGGDPKAPVVMHTCDNPSCVNPDHLVAGSYKGNMADMDAKGRRNVGKVGEHLKDRQAHPRAVAVITPHGEFASAALAAEHSPLTARTIQRYCQKQLNGYKYA